MTFLKTLSTNVSLFFELVSQLFKMLVEFKKWWLIPLVLSLSVFILLLIVFKISAVVAPFVYPFF